MLPKRMASRETRDARVIFIIRMRSPHSEAAVLPASDVLLPAFSLQESSVAHAVRAACALYPRVAPVGAGPALNDLVLRDCSAACQEGGHCVRVAHLDGPPRDVRSLAADWAPPQDVPADCPADSCRDDPWAVLPGAGRSLRALRQGGSVSADYFPQAEGSPHAGPADSCRDGPWGVGSADDRSSAEPRSGSSVRVDSAGCSMVLLAAFLSRGDYLADSYLAVRWAAMVSADSVARGSPPDVRSEVADCPVGSRAAVCRSVEEHSADFRAGSVDGLHSAPPLSRSLVFREVLV